MEPIRKRRDYQFFCLLLMLLVYLAAVVWINFSMTPGFYDADMYSDILYSMKAWEEKTIFPQNWIFGNQRNAVSPPVLAALLYGLLGDPFLAMAWASTIMGFLSLAALDWMLRPALKTGKERLVCLVTFLAVVLYFGGAVTDNRGWSLFFTMCAYYAGYSITAFLAFGCYLRAGRKLDGRLWAMLALTCVLSFGTGLQSIRQTAVMVIPLAAAEFLRILPSVVRKQPVEKAQLVTAGAVSIANLAGLVCASRVQINQVEILGSIQLRQPSDWPGALADCVMVIFRMLMTGERISYLVLAAMLLVCIAALPVFWKRLRQRQEGQAVTLLFLLVMSVAVIMGVAVGTTMQVWGRYYFLLYPLIGFLAASGFGTWKKTGRFMILAFLTVLLGMNCFLELRQTGEEMALAEQDPAYAVCGYLEENNYDYLFSIWGHGEGVAVVSGAEIMVGFWDLMETPFKPMGYLYDPAILAAEPERCAYLIEGAEAVSIAKEAARAAGTELELLRYFEETDCYLFTASINLMKVYS